MADYMIKLVKTFEKSLRLTENKVTKVTLQVKKTVPLLPLVSPIFNEVLPTLNLRLRSCPISTTRCLIYVLFCIDKEKTMKVDCAGEK